MTINVIRIQNEAIPPESIISKSVAAIDEQTLPVVEMFYGIEGEGLYVGQPRILVRLGGCRLKCHGCDSPNTWNANKNSTLYKLIDLKNEVLSLAKEKGVRTVAITGGEPMHYPYQIAWLCRELQCHGIKPWIETSGYYFPDTTEYGCNLENALLGAFWSFDIKTPSSKEAALTPESVGKFCDELMTLVCRAAQKDTQLDFQVKCIVTDEADLNFIRDVVMPKMHHLGRFVITPACGVRGTAEDVSRVTETIMKYVSNNSHVFELNKIRVIAQQHQLLKMR